MPVYQEAACNRAQAGEIEIAYLELGEGPPVFLYHGFPDIATAFLPVARDLAKAGYRCVIPWLRGYAPSALADYYDAGTLVADAIGLLAALELEQVHLVGHDWGGDVVYGLSAARPQLVASAVVLAVPHSRALRANRLADFEQLRLSFYQWLFQLDFAEEVVSRDDFVFIRNLWREWSSGWIPPSDHLDEVIETLQRPGVLTAALTYYRTALGHARTDAGVEDLRKSSEGDISVPTLLLLGTRDRCLLPRMAQGAEGAFAGPYRSESLDAGHFLHLERPHEVSKAAAAWFESYPIAAV
jgi:pimeloyl-ACP methyl ester carboxylesterase